MSISDVVTDPLDFVRMNGAKTPGVARVAGAALRRTFDKRKGFATSGGSFVYTGEDPGSFTVTLEFWAWWGGQEKEWIEFAKRVLVKEPKGTPKAYAVEHPHLNAPPVSIDAAELEEVSQPKIDDTGLVSVEMKFHQYRPPTPALGKANGTSKKSSGSGSSSKKPAPTAKDAADEQIEKLLKQLHEVANS